ncbi:hypothetical protein MKW94_021170, partial [Papaver nudicaule]|nr:hypothetical protein [Papaver nudicaule]MCL7037321.1 hypothetical protein [Papaver nudicaule]
NYGDYPNDAANLTRWGAVLLDLTQFQTDAESKNLILDGISKLEEALSINPEMHDVIWCLGSGHMMHGLLIPDYNVARDYFDRAAEYYQQAVEKDPGNQKYLHSSIKIAEASKLHAEIYKHGVAQQAAGAGSGSSNSYAKVNTSLPGPSSSVEI